MGWFGADMYAVFWCLDGVLLIRSVHPLYEGQEKVAIAVKIADDLVDVYIIDEKTYYHYNFKVIGWMIILGVIALGGPFFIIGQIW